MRRKWVAWTLIGALWLGAACSGDDSADGDNAGDTTATTDEPATSPTVDELLAQNHTLSIAHAGGEVDYPHSTLFGYGESVRAGADVLEMDVQLSQDGELVVIHDATVDRTTEAEGPVAERTAAELAELDAAYGFTPNCWECPDLPADAYPYRGTRTGDREAPEGYTADDFGIPTLAEVSERFPGLPLDIEIKGSGETALAVATALAVELVELGRTDSSVVVSFDQAAVDAFRAAAPDVATSPGVAALTDWYLAAAPLDGYRVLQVPPDYEGVHIIAPETIARAHADGLEVWVWMNEDSQESADYYAELVELGIDGIIGGRPEVMAEVIGA